jgi:type II secretory pathway pseudopilin PulG
MALPHRHIPEQCNRLKVAARGFTIIEITVAVLILAGSLVVLLGLQSSATGRSVDDRIRQQAMLETRRILTALELAVEEPAVGELVGTVNEVLEKIYPPFVASSDNFATREELPKLPYTFEARLNVTAWNLPKIENALRRVTVTVAWGQRRDEEYSVEYFLPHTAEEEVSDGVE